MAFLDDLSNSFLDQGGIAENKTRSLDTRGPVNVPGFGNNVPYGALNDISEGFTGRIDKSAQREYTETGTIRGIKPRVSQILIQEPDLTVVVKKRMFSSLSENFRTDLMDNNEKLFIRASKRLFSNKCNAIAAYERLSKIERISNNNGTMGDFIMPLMFSAIDTLTAIKPDLINGETREKLETIRKMKVLSNPSYVTTWTDDKQVSYASNTGEGNGTFELTLVNTFSCTNSVELGGSNAQLTIQDPYNLMVITNEDIDQAISDAASRASQNNFLRISEQQLDQATKDLQLKLNKTRAQRGVSLIKFLISEETLLFKKIRAIIEEEGKEIDFTFDAGTFGINLLDPTTSTIQLAPSATEGPNGLSEDTPTGDVEIFGGASSESDLFKQIINNLYLSIGMRESTKFQIKNFNKDTNYVRRKMRLHFGNKSIIQPLDVISVFITSKTGIDRKIVQGLDATFRSNSLLNKLNDTIGNIESAFEDIQQAFSGTAPGSFTEIEKNSIAGQGFPLWLWMLMRNDFTRQAAGTCVFNGVAKSAQQIYANGSYNLQVEIGDNSDYLTFGQVNVNPSVSVYNGALYDPLTPFKLNFDVATGFSESKGGIPPFLDENIKRAKSGMLRYKAGKNVGKLYDEENSELPSIEKISSALFRRKFNNPDGLIYRWKEGIGSLILFGQPNSQIKLGSIQSEASPKITQKPYAGQDAMNVLSLLITGQPYNFNNFLRAALKSDASIRDGFNNTNNTTSFFKSLLGELSTTNATWGNFIPFKALETNDQTYKFLARGQFDIIQANQSISDKLEERAKKFDILTEAVASYSNVPEFYRVDKYGQIEVSGIDEERRNTQDVKNLMSQIIELDKQIEIQLVTFHQAAGEASRQSDNTLVIAGENVSYDPSIVDVGKADQQRQKARARSDLRKKLNYLTLRRLWKVKANEDANLFIVDDSYDKNYDIQAFEESLISGSLSTFNSNYASVLDTVKEITELIQLEVFADSQGHIRARAPKYNRMPSSVFQRMVSENETKGIQIFPEFLIYLFVNQVEGLTDQLEIVEDEIRIRAAAIGYIDDGQVNKAFGIDFLTDEDTGKLVGADFRDLFYQQDPERNESELNNALFSTANVITSQLKRRVHFNIDKRLNVALRLRFDANTATDIDSRITKIAKRLKDRQNTPKPLNRSDILSKNVTTKGTGNKLTQADVVKVTGDISGFVSERQDNIKLLANAISNLTQGNSANNNPKMVLYTNLIKGGDKDEFPEILEGMIEDENYDDYGPGAGKRFILSGEKLIGFTLTEKAPPFTMMQVNGKLAKNLVADPSELGLEKGGNGISTAIAVDYDMWRMYGFRQVSALETPYLKDPYTQCAPMAVYQLNKARKNILQATASVTGNEYIQAGEVYYIEDRDLLFYSNSISHSFEYGQRFETSLNLTYGHNPGEYIPTTLDIIGKGLYTNRHQAHLARQDRFENADGSLPVGVLGYNPSRDSFDSQNPLKTLVGGTFKDQNIQVLNNILLTLAGYTSPSSSNSKLIMEIRIYHDDENNPSEDLEKIADSIIAWLKAPQKKSIIDDETLIPINKIPNFVITKDNPRVKSIDLSQDSDLEYTAVSPSAQAWNIFSDLDPKGWDITETVGGKDLGGLTNNEKRLFYDSIIDIWIKFENPPSKITQLEPKEKSLNEEQQRINKLYETYNTEFLKLIK